MSDISIPHVVKLEYPLEYGPEDNLKVVEEVTFNRRPTSGDMRGVKLSDLENLSLGMSVVCRISDFPVALKGKLDAADATELVAVLPRFLDLGR